MMTSDQYPITIPALCFTVYKLIKADMPKDSFTQVLLSLKTILEMEGILDTRSSSPDLTSAIDFDVNSARQMTTDNCESLFYNAVSESDLHMQQQVQLYLDRLSRKNLEVENLRKKLLYRYNMWLQSWVGILQLHTPALAREGKQLEAVSQEIQDYFRVQNKSPEDVQNEVHRLINSPNVNSWGMLDLDDLNAYGVPDLEQFDRFQMADLDLHVLKHKKAMEIFRARLNHHLICAKFLKETFFWFVITGKGNHSKQGTVTIKQDVLRLLQDTQINNNQSSGIKFNESRGNEGKIVVVFYSR